MTWTIRLARIAAHLADTARRSAHLDRATLRRRLTTARDALTALLETVP